MNNKAVIILHEIYGINSFIEEECAKFKKAEFDRYKEYRRYSQTAKVEV